MPYTYRPPSPGFPSAAAAPAAADFGDLRGLDPFLFGIDVSALSGFRSGLSMGNREYDFENCTFSFTAAYLNPSAVVFNDSLDNPQSQTSPLLAFRSYEGLEHGAPNLLRNAGTSIGDENADSAFASADRLDVLSTDGHLSAAGHAVLRIHHQV